VKKPASFWIARGAAEHGTDVEPRGKSAPQSLRRLRFPGCRGRVGGSVQGGTSRPVARYHRISGGQGCSLVHVQSERLPVRGDVRGRERRSARSWRTRRVAADGPDRGERRTGRGAAMRIEPELEHEQLARERGDGPTRRAGAHHDRMHPGPARTETQLRIHAADSEDDLHARTNRHRELLDSEKCAAAGRAAMRVQPLARQRD
jgi:hypothetical protein